MIPVFAILHYNRPDLLERCVNSIDYPIGIHGGQGFEERTYVISDALEQSNLTNKQFFAINGDSKHPYLVDRVREILDGRKNISTASMEIYLVPPYNEGKILSVLAVGNKLSKVIKLFSKDEIEFCKLCSNKGSFV